MFVLQAMMHPKNLQPPEYKLNKTIPLGQRNYLFDMTCTGKGILAVSDAFYHSINNRHILFNSPAGLKFILHIKIGFVQIHHKSYRNG